MDRAKRKRTKKNCRGHSRLCSELRTKKKNHRGHGRWRRAGVHGPTAVDSTISSRSVRCPLRAPAAASPRHQHLAAVCLLQRYPLCSPAHRRIGSGCCVHSLLLSRHAASARSAFTFSTRLSSTLRSCSHPCPHHCSRPWPDGSGPRARSSQVNHSRCTGSGSPRGAPRRRSTTRCPRHLSTVPGSALPVCSPW